MIETLLYSAVRDCPSPEAEELLRKAIAQHDQIARLIGEISLLRPNERQYDGKIRVLRECLDRHVEEEEGRIFDALRRCLSRKDLERLGREMEALQNSRGTVNRGFVGRQPAVG